MKGQYFSFDAVIGFTIFILVLMTILSYWYSATSYFHTVENPMNKEAYRISEIVLSDSSLGCTSDGMLSLSKCDSLLGSLDEDRLRAAYNSPYNFSVQIQAADYSGRGVPDFQRTYPALAPTSYSESYVLTRVSPVYYNDESYPAKITIIVYS